MINNKSAIYLFKLIHKYQIFFWRVPPAARILYLFECSIKRLWRSTDRYRDAALVNCVRVLTIIFTPRLNMMCLIFRFSIECPMIIPNPKILAITCVTFVLNSDYISPSHSLGLDSKSTTYSSINKWVFDFNYELHGIHSGAGALRYGLRLTSISKIILMDEDSLALLPTDVFMR